MASVAQLGPSEQAAFIRKTYLHLAGAIVASVGVSVLLFLTRIAPVMGGLVLSHRLGWLLMVGALSLLGWMAKSLLAKANEVGTQYFSLGLYVMVQALIFSPMLLLAAFCVDDGDIIPLAWLLTLLLSAGLAVIAVTSKRDFSCLGSLLTIGGFIVLGLMMGKAIFGFDRGLLSAGGMVVFIAAVMLYGTSQLLHRYSSRDYVAASLELLASVALLCWYTLRILIGLPWR